MTKKREKPRNKLFRSLAFTMATGAFLVLLLTYGVAGFLLFQYFRENPTQLHDQEKRQFLPASAMSDDAAEILPPVLAQPMAEKITGYFERIENSSVKSYAQITAQKEGVFIIEAGESEGCGVLISQQGHIITPFHVIEPSPYLVKATHQDGSGERFVHELMLLGYDEHRDLALLKCKDTRNLSVPPVPLGHVESLRTGQHIMIIGTFKEADYQVSEGIFSGLQQWGESTYLKLAGTQQPAVSGAAVLNLEGELIGIISLAVQVNDNSCAAISSDTIRKLIDANTHWVNP